MKQLQTLLISLLFLAKSPQTLAQNVGAEWLIKPVFSGFDTFYFMPNDYGLYMAVKNGKKGVVNESGKQIMPFEFDKIILNPGGFNGAHADNFKVNYCFLPSGKTLESMGVTDKTLFQDGTCAIKKNGKWGLIDAAEKELIPVEYDYVAYDQATNSHVFSKNTGEKKSHKNEATATFKSLEDKNLKHAKEKWPGRIIFTDMRKNKSGFLNLNGDTLARATYTGLTFHPKGYAAGCLDKGNCIVIDQNNKPVFDYAFESFPYKCFVGNLAFIGKKGGKEGAVRVPDGKIIVPFEYDNVFALERINGFIVKKEGKHGVLDSEGKTLHPVEFDEVDDSKKWAIKMARNKMGGWWHPQSNFYLEPKYRVVKNLDDSILVVMRDSLYGLVDGKTGRELCSFDYTNISKSYDRFIAEVSKGKGRSQNVLQSVIGRDGRIVLPLDSARMVVFPDNTLWVIKKSGDIDHLDKSGARLRHFEKGKARGVSGIYIEVSDRPKPGIYCLASDPPGQENWLESVSDLAEDLRLTKKNGLWGYTDAKGVWVIQPVFDEAHASNSGAMKVKYKGKWGVLKNPIFKSMY